MKAHYATFVASAISGVTLLASMVAILYIYKEVQSIWNHLDSEINLFRATTDDLWHDMMRLGRVERSRRQSYGQANSYGSSDPGYESPKQYGGGGAANPGNEGGSYSGGLYTPDVTEPKEQLLTQPYDQSTSPTPPLQNNSSASDKGAQCECRAQNSCPAGLPGPKGNPGHRGEDGLPGEDAKPGVDAMDIEEVQATLVCFHCPAGPPGPPGALGRPGPRGMSGAKGQAGMPGRDGNPGLPGEQGPSGPQGLDGEIGSAGEKGVDAEHPIGRLGLKGEVGLEGPPGLPGLPGIGAANGIRGPPGERGNTGDRGPQGPAGPQGAPGAPGRTGKDAEYCPCPDHRAADARKLKLKAA